MLEDYLIECCSPTLASLKAGSLFNYIYANEKEPSVPLDTWNDRFAAAGLQLCLLRKTDHSALIYVYRISHLRALLEDPEIRAFLQSYGYVFPEGAGALTPAGCGDDKWLQACLAHLSSRIRGCGADMAFPHEIGVFLGYPLYDVKCFIRDHGRNYKRIGTWKVYGDENSAVRTFDRFSKCRDVYTRLWRSGRRSILQLTVAG